MQNKKLKINFILPACSLTGGPLAILEYANRLIERGHEVSITTPSNLFWRGSHPFGWFDFKGKVYYKKYGKIQRVILKTLVNYVIKFLLKLGGRRAEKMQLFTLVIDFLSSLSTIARIPECDLNIATLWTTSYAAYLSNKGKPVYFMQHYEEVFYDNEPVNILKRFAVRMSYALPVYKVANSSWLQKQIEEKFGQHVPFSNNALDVKDFNPAEKQSEKDGIIRVITYSRPESWKGFQDAAAAMKIIFEKYKGRIEWNVFGALYKNIPPENELAPYKYHKGLPFKELAALYASSDIALCPSWYESFPLPPLEAMASGTATVTTSYGTEDYAFHEQNALVVKPRDIAAMTEAIERLINDSELRKKLALEGRITAERFNWDSAVEKREKILLDIYEGKTSYDVEKATRINLKDVSGIDFDFAPVDVEIEEGEILRDKKGNYYRIINCQKKIINDINLIENYKNTEMKTLDNIEISRIP